MATNSSRIEISADLDKVWAALTQPELVKQWQYGSDFTTDWKIGSKISFKNEWESKVFEQCGTVLAFNPNKNLKYSLFFLGPDSEDKPENYFEMEYRLTPMESKTLLEIIQEDHRAEAQQEEVQGEENPILKRLKELLETA